jgi:hypothetical protein
MSQTANLFLMEFTALCGQWGVSPAVAIEDPAVREAIKARDLEALNEALSNVF